MSSGWAVLLPMAAAAAAAAVAVTPPPTAARRLDVSRRSTAGPRRRPRRSPPGASIGGTPLLLQPAVRTGLAGAAGLAVVMMVGGVSGVVLGLVTAITLPRLVARLPDPALAARERQLAADLPLTLELTAACLAAGAPLTVALQAVSADLPGPLSGILADVARQLNWGATPAGAWRRARGSASLEPLVETFARVGDSGAALGPALRRLAVEERSRAHQTQAAAVRRIGVFVVIPLGICFLPAYLLLGVVPIVAGLVGGLLF